MAVENPATNETADPIRKGSYEFSVHAMWAGRSYEAISVFRSITSCSGSKAALRRCRSRGHEWHSLGAKPALILGVLDPTIKAVVWNDTTIDWRERAVATNLERIGTFQYVPGMLAWFDYSDLQASLAPRAFLITEGGRTVILNKIRRAYELLGAVDRFQVVYYPKYATADKRPLGRQGVARGSQHGGVFSLCQHRRTDAPLQGEGSCAVVDEGAEKMSR